MSGATKDGISSLFYIEITYQEVGPGAQPVTYAVPVPAIVGDARASSIAFEMERQYTFQFELFGNNKPIVITNVTAIDGSWSTNDGLAYGSIPYMTASPGSSSTADPYLTDQTTDANIGDLKGDICVYLTKIGAAPKGKRWRMPTMDEFKATIADEYQLIPATGGWTGITGNNAAGTTVISSGYTKVSTNRPYFPASGGRYSGSGGLTGVGINGFYWSSSPLNTASGDAMYFNSTTVSTAGAAIRTSGYSVRCVVE